MRSFGFKIVNTFLVLAVLALMVTGCGKSSTVSKTPTPPQIPPQETFLITFDEFNSNGISAISDQESQMKFAGLASSDSMQDIIQQAILEDQANWIHAAVSVGFWSVVAVVGLAVPIAAFKASFLNTPVQQPDGSWVWSYTVPVFGTYTAELHGTYIDKGVHWEMNISKQGEYTDFLWYYGESDLTVTEGYWILKEKPQNPNDLLRIDWHRNIADGTYDIKYTNIKSGATENGGYIFAQYTKQTPYDHSWDIYNKGQNNHTYIEWNSSTEAGRVQDYNKYYNNNWNCWDTSHMNCACP